MSDFVTQAEFARSQGWARSYVTELKQAGRLVLVDGKVDVAASLSLIAQTKGGRDDVAERHEQEREQPAAEPAQRREESPDSAVDKVGSSYQAARAVKEKYAALQAKADYEKSIGDLIPRADVDFVLSDYGATLRVLLENLADRLAPVLYPINNLEETHAAIEDAAQSILAEISEAMRRRGVDVAKTEVTLT